MKNLYSLFTLFLVSISLNAQQTIHGKILDKETKEALPFANVLINSWQGTISNAEGHFFIDISTDVKQLEISYIGFEKKIVRLVPNQINYTIWLSPSVESLETVVISGKYVNPAIALMKRIIKQKSKNDYRKKLKKYSYTKYYKFLVTADPDSINGALDTIYRNDKMLKIDSSQYTFKKELEDKDLFVMESVIKTNAKNGVEKNKVIASRTAGFKNPMYELLAMQVSGQNIYDDTYKFLVKKYLGPLTNLSLKQYQYEIDDTISMQNRKVYVLSYLNTKKPLISGKIYVDVQSLAIAKMSLNTYKEFELQTTHLFKYSSGEDVWFPIEANMIIKKAKKKDELSLAGGAIRVTDTTIKEDSIKHTNKTNAMDYMYAISKTKFLDVNIGNLHQDKITYNLQIAPDANNKSNEFWNQYRDVKRQKREANTYKFIDSIADEEGFENKINSIRKLAKGYIPYGIFDLSLIDLIDKNKYEGYRLSLGGKTNEKLSNKFFIETYLAYGFKDNELKYQGKFNYKINHLRQTYLYASYTKDLKKSASFTSNKETVFQDALGDLSKNKYYMHKSYSIGVTHLFSKSLKTNFYVQDQSIQLKHDIPPKIGRLEFPNKNITSFSFDLEYQPFTSFFLSPRGREILKEGYPKFHFNIEKSVPLWGNTDSFYRFNLQTNYKKIHLNKDNTYIDLKLGYASENASIIHLFSPQSNGYLYSDESWYQKIHLRTANTNFETIYNLEFVDNFVSTLHLSHTFSKIKFTKNYNFDLRLIGRAAWGISYRSNSYIGIKSLNDMYYETGIELNRLIKFYKQGFGIGAYYRLGAYAHDKSIDNLSVKITFTPSNFFD